MEVKKVPVKNIHELNTQYGYTENEEKAKDWLMEFLEYIKQSKERDLARLKRTV